MYTLLIYPYVCKASRMRILHGSMKDYGRTMRWSWNRFSLGKISDPIIRNCLAIQRLLVEPRIRNSYIDTPSSMCTGICNDVVVAGFAIRAWRNESEADRQMERSFDEGSAFNFVDGSQKCVLASVNLPKIQIRIFLHHRVVCRQEGAQAARSEVLCAYSYSAPKSACRSQPHTGLDATPMFRLHTKAFESGHFRSS